MLWELVKSFHHEDAIRSFDEGIIPPGQKLVASIQGLRLLQLYIPYLIRHKDDIKNSHERK